MTRLARFLAPAATVMVATVLVVPGETRDKVLVLVALLLLAITGLLASAVES